LFPQVNLGGRSWEVVPGTPRYPNVERTRAFFALLQTFLPA
jgi:hypothetical protein